MLSRKSPFVLPCQRHQELWNPVQFIQTGGDLKSGQREDPSAEVSLRQKLSLGYQKTHEVHGTFGIKTDIGLCPVTEK